MLKDIANDDIIKSIACLTQRHIDIENTKTDSRSAQLLSPNPKNSKHRDQAPGFKFSGSATGKGVHLLSLKYCDQLKCTANNFKLSVELKIVNIIINVRFVVQFFSDNVQSQKAQGSHRLIIQLMRLAPTTDRECQNEEQENHGAVLYK